MKNKPDLSEEVVKIIEELGGSNSLNAKTIQEIIGHIHTTYSYNVRNVCVEEGITFLHPRI